MMKKITESQLKDKVNSLREYLKVYELNEEDRGNDEYQAAAGAPADNRNIFQKGVDAVSDFHKKNTERFYAKQAADAAANSPEGMAAAKAKLTPSQLTWLGNAQPNSAILSRMPKPLPGETAPEAASTGTGLKPPKYGPFGTETRPLDGSDNRQVNGQGLKMPAQAPAAAGQRPGGVAFNQDKAAQDNPEDGMGAGQYPRVGPNTTVAQNSAAADAEMNGAPVAPVAPTAPNDATSLPPLAPAGEHATKVARFKELIAKAKELRTDKQVAHAKSLGDAMEGSTRYFLNKLRLIESRQLNEELSSEEQAEMDALSAELGQQGAENDPELVAAINDYNSFKNTPATSYTAQAPTASASAPAAAPAFNAAKDSQRANVTALSTELRAIADATEKLGPNATLDDFRPLFDRLKKVETDAAGAGEDVKSAVQATVTNVEAELKKVSGGAAAGTAADPNAAKSPYAGVKWEYAPGDGTVDGSAKMAADAAADKAAQANQAAAVRPPVAVDPRDGAVGQSLASMGVSKKDRLDQAFVNSTLGAGKYKAGSAESNMALQAHFKKQGSGSGAPATQAAGSLPASAGLAPGETIVPAVKRSSSAPVATGGAKAVAGLNKEPILPKPAPVTGTGSGGGRGPTAQQFTSDWNNKMKAAQKLGWPDSTKLPPADWAPMGKPPTGKNKMAPDLKEAVTYADDQTLARIVSLSRR